jgi:hypothetical protein
MDEAPAQILNLVALVVALVVASGIAGVSALRSGSPETARRQGFLGTLLLAPILGAFAGFFIDFLHPGFIPPATITLAIFEVPLGAAAGFFVGKGCSRVVSGRAPQTPADVNQETRD